MRTRTLARHVMIAVLALTAGMLFAGRAVAADDDSANPFPNVTFDASPKNVIVEAAGVYWLTFPDANKISRVVVTSNQAQAATTTTTVDYFSTGGGSKPYDLVMSNGQLWITLLGTNQIGRLNPATDDWQTYPIPTANSEPTGITAGGGFIWFVERKGDKLGKLDPGTGAITEYTDQDPNDSNLVDMRGAELEDVAFSAISGPWFTGPSFRTSVARFDVGTEKFVGAPAGSGAQPMQIRIDSIDQTWISAKGYNRLGRYGLNTLSLWDFFDLPAPPAGVDIPTSGPVGLFVIEHDGQIDVWYTRPGVNRIGRQIASANGTRLGQTETIVADGAPWGIVADANGTAWIAATGTNQLIQWGAPYFATFLHLAFIAR